MDKDWIIRPAREEDSKDVFEMIKGLARFQKLGEAVVGDEDLLRRSLFENKYAHCLLIEEKDQDLPVGFAIYFFNYSTFETRPGIHLEDIYIKEGYRPKGYGRLLMIKIAQIGVENGCARMEWSVLNWNQKAIDMYESIGAKPMDGRTTYRLDGENLVNLGKKDSK